MKGNTAQKGFAKAKYAEFIINITTVGAIYAF